MHSIGNMWLWSGFFVFILIVLGIDLFLLGKKKSGVMTTREACFWTMVWVACALIFNALLWWHLGNTYGSVIANQKALEFFTGYLVEKALSLDNMFVILMIFHFFAVPKEYQRRVLLYGVLGAIILRFIMVLAGTWVVTQFHWMLYVFGAFLVYTGIKMILLAETEKSLAENPLLIWMQKHIRITKQFHGEKFFIKQNLLWYATPLFLTVVLVEISDLIFALDSIPAIFAITQDPFIVFTSNIFAILGLRALYFLLANLATRFPLLKYGVALILCVIGVKMLIEPWVKMPVLIMLSIVATLLLTTILLSIFKTKKQRAK